MKDILLKNKNTIKFGDDRTIVKIYDKNVINAEQTEGKETIYKGFYTSANITESGLFLLVSNINKHVSEVTVWEAINQIRNDYRKEQESTIREKIEAYLLEHKTVLTVYGSLRAYRIKGIDFDGSPEKTTFNMREGDQMKTITIKEYYKRQYKVKIKHLDKPILIAERKTKAKNKKDKKDNKQNKENKDNKTENNAEKKENKENPDDKKNKEKEEQDIYLVPELLYVTGPTTADNNSRDKRRNTMQKTRADPNKKMEEIDKIHELIVSKE